jgi:hypothetical protein
MSKLHLIFRMNTSNAKLHLNFRICDALKDANDKIEIAGKR